MEVIHEDESEQEEEVVEELEGETHGRSLVVRRTLHSKPMPIEENQRDKIFQTRCKVEDRLCDVIIDSGSCANVVSTTLIDKLEWPTTDHPKPYKLHWLNDANEVK